MKLSVLMWMLQISLLSAAEQYSVRVDGDVVHLEDGKKQTVVSIIPSVGNIAYEMKVKGKNVLRFPFASIEDFKRKPAVAGIPLLAPWANRLDENAFYANGKKYTFNMELGNVNSLPGKANQPIHGFLSLVSQWKVIEAKADTESAWLTSRLEVYRNPDWMAQFPFAHTIQMTYRLQDGVLEVATRIDNLSAASMPVAIGYHSFFQLTDSPREEWTIGVGARTEWLVDGDMMPTGQTRPIEQLLKPDGTSLRGLGLDRVVTDLVRDSQGRATMWIQGKSQRLDLLYGPNYHASLIVVPNAPNRDFVLFEPMAGITNALNLAQRGVYQDLQTIPPGETWQASFWVRPSGF